MASSDSRSGTAVLRGRSRLLGLLGVVIEILVDESENIVEDKVARWLLGEDKSLNKFLRFGGLVRSLANDLDYDVVSGALRVNVGDADLAVLNIKILDPFLDCLLVMLEAGIPPSCCIVDCQGSLLTWRPTETFVTSASRPWTYWERFP